MSGWIKIHRDILSWEWYDDINTKTLFFHLILLANYEDKKWRGKKLLKGTIVTGYSKLGKELKLSTQQIRTALEKLKLTGEVTSETSNRGTIIQLINYKRYQEVTDEPLAKQQTDNNQITIKQQTDNNQITTIKERKEVKELKEIKKNKSNIENLINDSYPRLNKMKEPLTFEQGEKLEEDYEFSDIEHILGSMYNYEPLLKKNISTNLTIRSWLQRGKVSKKVSEAEKLNW